MILCSNCGWAAEQALTPEELEKRVNKVLPSLEKLPEVMSSGWHQAARGCMDALDKAHASTVAVAARAGVMWWIFNLFSAACFVLFWLNHRRLKRDLAWSFQRLHRCQVKLKLPDPVPSGYRPGRALPVAFIVLYGLMFLLINFVGIVL